MCIHIATDETNNNLLNKDDLFVSWFKIVPSLVIWELAQTTLNQPYNQAGRPA